MNKTLGIIGGGQLALMLIAAASKFGVKCICLDPNSKSVAFKYCYKYLVYDFFDEEGLKQLEKECDIIIYEFENIDLEVLKKVDNKKLYQGIDVLKYSKNRIREKELAKKNGFLLPNYRKVTNMNELETAILEIGYPGILKTLEFGYDGKGQVLIQNQNDLKLALNILNVDCVYEEKIDFICEISLIGIRDKKDEIKIFPPFINEHENGILHKTEHNDNLAESENVKICSKLFEKFMRDNDFFGILCIEFFVSDNEIYFNEMAPRPHNSGHVTLDSCNVSQFEQMVRAAIGYELIEPKLLRDMSMINVLGQNYEKAINILNTSNEAKVYIYGKEEVKKNRKMGHINLENEYLINTISKEFKSDK